MYEWAPGEKPKPTADTYVLLGKPAASIHQAADSFNPAWMRYDYNADLLIDQQLNRMQSLLSEAGRWDQMLAPQIFSSASSPIRNLSAASAIMESHARYVHRRGDQLTVFRLRQPQGNPGEHFEPHGVLRAFRKSPVNAWLEGYRTIRPFQPGR